jgi:hypothetical protein
MFTRHWRGESGFWVSLSMATSLFGGEALGKVGGASVAGGLFDVAVDAREPAP